MITKKQKDLVKGDIIFVEFADEGNFITVMVDAIKKYERFEGWYEITAHYKNGRSVVMYGREDSDVQIIGEQGWATV